MYAIARTNIDILLLSPDIKYLLRHLLPQFPVLTLLPLTLKMTKFPHRLLEKPHFSFSLSGHRGRVPQCYDLSAHRASDPYHHAVLFAPYIDRSSTRAPRHLGARPGALDPTGASDADESSRP